MTLGELFNIGVQKEEFAYAERAEILKHGLCPICKTRSHSYPNGFSEMWWCARCNHEFVVEA